MTAVRDRIRMVDELRAALRRHVGHTLRCSRDEVRDLEGYVLETLSLRCDDCGEVVFEAVTGRARRGIHART